MLLDSSDEPGEFPSLRRNTLIVKQLSRADLHAVFICQASNNNISQPVSASVTIEMHRKFNNFLINIRYFVQENDRMIRNIVHRLRKYENGFFGIELKIVLNEFNNNEKKGIE